MFGWNLRTEADTPEFRYSVLQQGELQYAGIMDAGHLPEGAPQGWRIYIEVASADDIAAKVAALGGTVTQEPVDTPVRPPRRLHRPDGCRLQRDAAAARPGLTRLGGHVRRIGPRPPTSPEAELHRFGGFLPPGAAVVLLPRQICTETVGFCLGRLSQGVGNLASWHST